MNTTKNLGLLHVFPGPNPRTIKCLVAAKYAGVEFTTHQVNLPVENRSPEFMAKFPFGHVPALETPEGVYLYESNAIVYYAATHKPELLGGDCPVKRSLVQQYLAANDTELFPPVITWILPILGFAPFDEATDRKAQANIHSAMAAFDKIIGNRDYFVGEGLTIADIVIACSLWLPYSMLLEEDSRQKYANLTRWFTKTVNEPTFKSVSGEFQFYTKQKQ